MSVFAVLKKMTLELLIGYFHVHCTIKKTALDRGQTDCVSLTHDLDFDLQSPASYGHGS